MARRPVLHARALALALACLVAGPALAKSPTRLVSYVVEAKIYTKFLFENNGAVPTEGLQGDINGIGTEYEMNVRGYVSDKVEAFVRVQSRLGADWSDYFLQDGSGSSEGGPPMDDADYMKFRGATVRIKDMPLPTRPTLWIGSADIDMFSPFTIGRIRFTERDNAKGVFVRGRLGPGTYDIGRVSVPRLWAGPNFNTGTFTTRDFAYGAAYDVTPMDGLRLELFGSYHRDNEFLGIKVEGDPVLDGGLGGIGTAKYFARYQNTAGSFEVTWDLTDTLILNAFGAYSTTRNNAGTLSGLGCCSYSPVLHPTPDDPATEADEGDSLSGGLAIARLEAYNLRGSPLSISVEGFSIGENYSSAMAARRESDVLLTQGFTHDIGNPNFGNDIRGDSTTGQSEQVVSLAADNGFIDWNENIAETAIGWRGFTIVPKYETARLRLDGELTLLDYNTNEQGRDMLMYPNFEFVGGAGAFGRIVDSTGTSRDVRDVYNFNQERSSTIFFLRGNYKFDLFRTSDVTATFKHVNDKDEVDTSDASDDYEGKLTEFGASVRSQINSELELTLGLKFYRYKEDNALRVERPFEVNTSGQAIAEVYDTDRDRFFARVLYRFGAADIAYTFDYFNQTRDVVADGVGFTQELKGRMRSIATVSVGF
jgi:hypothetical protein